MYENCLLCPRNCGVDRNFSSGFCGEGAGLKAARAALHFWEEPPISGMNGSGTVFFSGCNLKCVYCQNSPIARGSAGKEITIARLAQIFLSLEKQNAHNINLVTPTHFSPSIIEAVELSRKDGLSIPIVYNTGGYEKAEIIKGLKGTCDIFLTDMKYIRPDTAAKYSNAPDYFEEASAALDEMVAIAPKIVLDENGIMQKGVIVRHLLLPGHLIEAKMIVKYLYDRYGDAIFISLMDQYTPVCRDTRFPELHRTVTDYEYASLISYAQALGVKNAFIQEKGTAKESFIPPFDLTGI